MKVVKCFPKSNGKWLFRINSPHISALRAICDAGRRFEYRLNPMARGDDSLANWCIHPTDRDFQKLLRCRRIPVVQCDNRNNHSSRNARQYQQLPFYSAGYKVLCFHFSLRHSSRLLTRSVLNYSCEKDHRLSAFAFGWFPVQLTMEREGSSIVLVKKFR